MFMEKAKAETWRKVSSKLNICLSVQSGEEKAKEESDWNPFVLCWVYKTIFFRILNKLFLFSSCAMRSNKESRKLNKIRRNGHA